MDDRFFMDVIKLKSMTGCRIDEDGPRNRRFDARSEYGGHRPGTLLLDHRLDTLGPR